MRKAPYLGRIKLFWHLGYNIPLIKKLNYKEIIPLDVTPPGDVRPAFRNDYIHIREAVNNLIEQSGTFFNQPILLNNVPYSDRMDEVIIDGIIVGRLRFDTSKWKFEFVPSKKGARILLGYTFSRYKNNTKTIKKTRHIIVDNSAATKIARGFNVLAPGLISYSRFEKGDYVYIFSERDFFIGVGRAVIDSEDISYIQRGTVIKRKIYYGRNLSIEDTLKDLEEVNTLRQKLQDALERYRKKLDVYNKDISILYDRDLDPWRLLPPKLVDHWKLIIKMNVEALKLNEREAINFILNCARQYKSNFPTVSFSGGKDSAATLELVIRSGLNFIVLFIDTGIELPETGKYVLRIIRKIQNTYRETRITETIQDYVIHKSDHALVVVVPKNRFWNGVKNIGYPGMDWRWCCKSNKLAPARVVQTKYLKNNRLNFEGIRKYESIKRSREGRISKNIWTNQINAYPIYDWNAFETWLYILWRRVPINPLYGEGLIRIGCYPCPSSNMADFFILEKIHRDLFNNIKEIILDKSNESIKDKEEFFRQGSWRWLNPPRKLVNKAKLRRPFNDIIKYINEDGNFIEIEINEKVDIQSILKLINTVLKNQIVLLRKINLKNEDEEQNR